MKKTLFALSLCLLAWACVSAPIFKSPIWLGAVNSQYYNAATPWSPTNITGLVGWYQQSSPAFLPNFVTNLVSGKTNFANVSGAGTVANYMTEQASSKDVYVAPNQQGIVAKNLLPSDSNDVFFVCFSTDNALGGGAAYFSVVNNTNAFSQLLDAYSHRYTPRSPGDWSIFKATNSSLELDTLGTASQPSNTVFSSGIFSGNTVHIFEAKSYGTNVMLYADGALVLTSTNTAVHTTNSLAIGIYNRIPGYVPGGILPTACLEVLAYNRVLSASNSAIVGSWLAGKYGFGIYGNPTNYSGYASSYVAATNYFNTAPSINLLMRGLGPTSTNPVYNFYRESSVTPNSGWITPYLAYCQTASGSTNGIFNLDAGDRVVIATGQDDAGAAKVTGVTRFPTVILTRTGQSTVSVLARDYAVDALSPTEQTLAISIVNGSVTVNGFTGSLARFNWTGGITNNITYYQPIVQTWAPVSGGPVLKALFQGPSFPMYIPGDLGNGSINFNSRGFTGILTNTSANTSVALSLAYNTVPLAFGWASTAFLVTPLSTSAGQSMWFLHFDGIDPTILSSYADTSFTPVSVQTYRGLSASGVPQDAVPSYVVSTYGQNTALGTYAWNWGTINAMTASSGVDYGIYNSIANPAATNLSGRSFWVGGGTSVLSTADFYGNISRAYLWTNALSRSDTYGLFRSLETSDSVKSPWKDDNSSTTLVPTSGLTGWWRTEDIDFSLSPQFNYWPDSSPYGTTFNYYNVNPDSSSYPVVGSDNHGNYVAFDGNTSIVNDFQNNDTLSQTNVTVFLVLQQNDGGVGYGETIFDYVSGSGTGQWWITGWCGSSSPQYPYGNDPYGNGHYPIGLSYSAAFAGGDTWSDTWLSGTLVGLPPYDGANNLQIIGVKYDGSKITWFNYANNLTRYEYPAPGGNLNALSYGLLELGGVWSQWSEGFNGQIYEALTYKRALTDAEMTQVVGYLKKKFSL